MKVLKCVLPVAMCILSQNACAFAPTTSTRRMSVTKKSPLTVNQPGNSLNNMDLVNRLDFGRQQSSFFQMANVEDQGTDEKNFQINPTFAALWVGFLAFGFVKASAEGVGAGTVSGDILEKFIANPTSPGLNEIFFIVFNLLGLAPLVAASLIMPTAKFQKLPATPFIVASTAMGYGGLGLFMSSWAPVEKVTKSDLGWFTANVLENKFFSALLVALSASIFYSSGLIEALSTDAQGTINGFLDLTSQAAIALVSSVDLTILTLTMAILVYEDLKLRGEEDMQKALGLSASTMLLPIVGAAIYCVTRPSLPDDE